jgi:hypothetical protein
MAIRGFGPLRKNSAGARASFKKPAAKFAVGHFLGCVNKKTRVSLRLSFTPMGGGVFVVFDQIEVSASTKFNYAL